MMKSQNKKKSSELDPEVIDSVIGDGCSLYKASRVSHSEIKNHVTVGDFSRVDYSFLAQNCRIDRNNHIYSSSIGKYSYTGISTVVMKARIGSFCSISWNASIGGGEHDYSRMTQHSFLYNKSDKLRPDHEPECYDRFSSPIEIGNDVWIAANAVIMRGVSIGNGAVVGANAVVTKNVPPFAIVVGNPAKIVKYRFNDSIIDLINRLAWWDWPDEKIRRYYGVLSQNPKLEVLNELINQQFDLK